MKMVTKVIDYKVMNGKRYYKVKWECSWELEDNLFHCQELVDQFWNFVDRVKNEDNRIHKKARIDDDEKMPSKHFPNIASQTKRNVRNNIPEIGNRDFGGSEVAITHIKLEEVSEHVHPSPLSKSTLTFISADEQITHAPGTNGNGEELIRRAIKRIKEPVSDTSVMMDRQVEDGNSADENHELVSGLLSSSMNHLSADVDSPHFKSVSMTDTDRRVYDTINGDSEHEDADMEREREEIAKSPIDEIFEPDPNDVVLHWNNPYVRISFRCRICNEEQSFSDKDEKWRKHFLKHVEGAHQAEELTEPCLMTDVSQEAIDIIQDPEKPWIQKVEYIIQTWGVNQYVRLAFLCRCCGKEQQPLHTGNWRNHYNSHKHNRPHSCQKCSKTFKSRSYLNQHLKMVHDKVEGIGLRSCFVCSKVFTRRLDMRRHIADVHNIDPMNHMTQTEWEYKSTVITNQVHTFKNGSSADKTKDKVDETKDKDSDSPSVYGSNDARKVESVHQTYPPKNDPKKQRKNYNSTNENVDDKKNFKHVCGICQERFKKKVDLKCHTVNIHCIDISNATNNADMYTDEQRESLTPTMVDLVQNTSVRGIHDYLRGKRTRAGQAKKNESDDLCILVKEEVISSESEGTGCNELTIDERHSFSNV